MRHTLSIGRKCRRGAAVLALLCFGLSSCAEEESRPGTPYRFVKIGTAREQVWRFYGGNPNEETLIYGNDLARFANGRLQWSMTGKGEKTSWSIEKDMSRAEVEAILGRPTKACESYSVGDFEHHWFCYVDGRVMEKSVGHGPVP